jgi:KaiC/GvpD/RAD55 family RecA-like ATPase
LFGKRLPVTDSVPGLRSVVADSVVRAKVHHPPANHVDQASTNESGTTDTESLDLISIAHILTTEEARIELGVERIPTGWSRLDRALGGGFTVPSLNVLGAAPKSGKSTFAQMFATHHVEGGGFVYYLDVENGKRRFIRQLLCRHARLGPAEAALALRDERAGVFTSREAVERWRAAKAWVRGLGSNLYVEFRPPENFEARIKDIRELAGKRQLVVVVDSLQKLPGDLSDRRAVVDTWVRFFERLRHEHDAVFLVISEIKRAAGGGYVASESAFKESGGIEYAADLAMTLTRPGAEEGEEALATLRVELARDSDEDPRGNVASYSPVFPYYGLAEIDPVRIEPPKPGRKPKASGAAKQFLRGLLGNGAAKVSDIRAKATAAGISRSTLNRVQNDLDIVECTVGLEPGWKMPGA